MRIVFLSLALVTALSSDAACQLPPDAQTLIKEAAAILANAGSIDQVVDKYTDTPLDELDLMKIGAEADAAAASYQNHYEHAEAVMRKAVAAIGSADPSLKGYPARKKAVDALRGIYPKSFALKPEPVLQKPAGVGEPPALSEKYKPLLALKQGYWNDPLYRELMNTPAALLPDGAMLGLCHLRQYNTTSLLRGDEIAEPVGEIIKRYGERFLPAALECLSKPDVYGWDSKIDVNATGDLWFHPGAGDDMFSAAARWPQAQAEILFRAAFEAGWNNAGRNLPDTEWARALYKEFENGPYGRPVTPAAYRF